MNTINAECGDSKLDDSVFNNVFQKWWPDLQSEVQDILKNSENHAVQQPQRSDRNIMEEVLELSRMAMRERRIDRGRALPGKIIFELFNSIEGLVEMINKNGVDENASSTLKRLIYPLDIIINSFVDDTSLIPRLSRLLEMIEFYAGGNASRRTVRAARRATAAQLIDDQ